MLNAEYEPTALRSRPVGTEVTDQPLGTIEKAYRPAIDHGIRVGPLVEDMAHQQPDVHAVFHRECPSCGDELSDHLFRGRPLQLHRPALLELGVESLDDRGVETLFVREVIRERGHVDIRRLSHGTDRRPGIAALRKQR